MLSLLAEGVTVDDFLIGYQVLEAACLVRETALASYAEAKRV